MFKRKKTARPNVTAIVVAAGSGNRMGGPVKKQFVEIAGKPLVAHSLLALDNAETVTEIIVVTQEQDVLLIGDIARNFGVRKLTKVVAGGPRRQDSVYIGVKEAKTAEIVAIHDAARPCVMPQDIDNVVNLAAEKGAAVLATRVVDTLKMAENGVITQTVERDGLWAVQTPQVFRREIIIKAHENAENTGLEATDDAFLVEHIGILVYIQEGSSDNIKVTNNADLSIVEGILLANLEGSFN